MIDAWVLDASPLILLGKADQLDWLPRLDGVVIPQAVADEVSAGRPGDPAAEWIRSATGSAMIVPEIPVPETLLAWDLGQGETAVLTWVKNHPQHTAVVDDAAARRCAKVFGLFVCGSLGLLAIAKRRGFIAECRPIFARMQRSGLFVTPALLEQAARSVGE